MSTAKIERLLERPLGYHPENKEAFHREAKRLLKLLAGQLGLSRGSYDIRSNMGGIAVAGEVTLHTERLYIQIFKPLTDMGNQIMYRRCDGRKDFTGGPNHFAKIHRLLDAAFIAELRRLAST